MALDGIVIHNIVSELNSVLKDMRVDRIYQPSRDELTFMFQKIQLTVSANAGTARACISTIKKENPEVAPMFCMLLRKHLIPSRVLRVYQEGFERIIKIDFDTLNEMGDRQVKTLVTELMGRHSNIILTDETGRILDAIKHIDISVSSVRQILPGLIYEGAPSQNKLNPLDLSETEISDALKDCSMDISADKALLETFCGLSPMACREIVYRAEELFDKPVTKDNIERISASAYEFFQSIKAENFSPCIIYEGSRKKDFSSFVPRQYGNAVSICDFSSVSEAVEDFYAGRDAEERHKQKTSALSKLVSNLISHASKKINIYADKIKDSESRDKYKLRGDLLMANIYQLKGGEDSITLQNFYDENGGNIKISLDPSLSGAQNAQKLYSKYTKLKTAGIMAQKMLEQTKEELLYLESVQQFISQITASAELSQIREELSEQGYIAKHRGKKQKTKPAKPLEIESSEGFKILVGKNNIQNDYVTFKASRSRDIWLHTKNIPGSHTVIVRGNAEKIPDSVIIEAAHICAAHSKAKDGVKVPVDYTEIKNVKKISGAKPGMVIYDNYNTVYVTPKENL